MKNITWTDGIGSRGRQNKLLVIPAGEKPYWFNGGSDKNVRVASSHYTKDGKWSRTQYELEIADNARALPVSQGWESGKWREGFAKALDLKPTATWQDVSTILQIPEDSLIGPKPEKGPGKFVIIPDGPPPSQSEVD